MAFYYVRSTDGNNGDGGTTWALAKADLVGAGAVDSAGDSIFVSHVHAESTAGAVAPAWAGTIGSPVKIICVNDGAEPPTTLATTGTVTTTGNNSITIGPSAGFLYYYGITFTAGSGASGAAGIDSQASNLVMENCNLRIGTTDSSSAITFSSSNSIDNVLLNCGVRFGAAGQGLSTTNHLKIKGGSLLSGGTSPTNLFSSMGSGTRVFIDGFDLSNASSTVNIVGSTSNLVRFLMRNCKLPASWSGSLNSSTPGVGAVYEMINCDGADTSYKYYKQTRAGTIQDDAVVLLSGGANNGTANYSLKMVSGTNVGYPTAFLESPELIIYNTTIGSSVTATVEIVHTNALNLTDNEIWVSLEYLGTSGYPLGSFVSDNTILSAPDQSTSTATWDTSSLIGTPITQKLTVSFTAQEVGMVIVTVCLAKASATVYVDPKVVLT